LHAPPDLLAGFGDGEGKEERRERKGMGGKREGRERGGERGEKRGIFCHPLIFPACLWAEKVGIRTVFCDII